MAKASKKNNAKMNSNSLIAIVALVLVISVGYAFLSANLRINGNTTLKANKWNVHFDNFQVVDGSVAATQDPDYSDENNTSLTYGINLAKPGDFYEFTIDVENEGTIDAMLSTFTYGGIEGKTDYLTYTVTYDNEDETAVAPSDKLPAGKKVPLRVRVEFKRDITNAQLPSDDQDLTLTVNATYVQADTTANALDFVTDID